jgi:hypothetical protein
MRLLASIVAAAAVWTAYGQGTFEAVEDYDPDNQTPALWDGTVGAAFGVTNDITVTALGCFDYLLGPGQGAVEVGLWNSTGALLASNTITASSTLFNQSRYQAVTPVFLVPGQTYHLGAFPTNGTWSGLYIEAPSVGGSVVTAPEIVLGNSAQVAGGFASPIEVTNTPGAYYLAPNFEFQNSTPEPSPGLLLTLAGLLFLTCKKRRSRAPNAA